MLLINISQIIAIIIIIAKNTCAKWSKMMESCQKKVTKHKTIGTKFRLFSNVTLFRYINEMNLHNSVHI